ncbi:hypothetical protein CK203_052148 [Vitis vinifera]|uniref:Retrotransposon gag domain-containing protein n=1 Tax=Vitis vinifera TaxID=29760 RepID=A0A438GA09_VITVI|nr:hypothetical protein CK203_052148 [Vitis vinifera]
MEDTEEFNNNNNRPRPPMQGQRTMRSSKSSQGDCCSCPHHGFDNWMLVSYFYEGMSPPMKQLLETMCGGDFMNKNPDEAFQFLDYVEGLDVQAKFATIMRRLDDLEAKGVQECKTCLQQANALGTYKQYSSNSPYSNTYNPGWRNHPNLSWRGGNNGQFPTARKPISG